MTAKITRDNIEAYIRNASTTGMDVVLAIEQGDVMESVEVHKK